jgi:nucleoside-diphosphate-sugar epimerase
VGGTVENPESDGQGNINLIEAAAAAGVKKFVLVTSVGTGDSKHAPTPEVYNILKPVLLEKEKAEAALRVCFRNSDQSHQAVASLKDSNLSSFRGLQAFTI